MSRRINSPPLLNFSSSSSLPIALAAVVICLTNSSSLRRVLMVVPSNAFVSFCTSTNLAPPHHAYTASILREARVDKVRSQCQQVCPLGPSMKRLCSESMVAFEIFKKERFIQDRPMQPASSNMQKHVAAQTKLTGQQIDSSSQHMYQIVDK
mmetsp:Transcript_16805/g.46166  ORF Transcript_16805/g.46166 Transcript_16805/m.46166 type:complete len:152 (+) Transcript_16805:1405-1860(+)